MSKTKSVGSRVAGRKLFRAARIETLERRQLLSTVSFGNPIATALPAGFQPAQVLVTQGNNGDVFSNSVLVTSASGGGLLMHAASDGTFTVAKQINTTATILGAYDLPSGSTYVPSIFTTAGIMTLQGDGSFSAPSGLAYPSDAVPGAFVFGFGFNIDGGTAPDLVVERFKANQGDPSHGSLILAAFRMQNNSLNYGPEVDTTIATNVSGPLQLGTLVDGSFNFDNFDDIIANGSSLWLGNGDDTSRRGQL